MNYQASSGKPELGHLLGAFPLAVLVLREEAGAVLHLLLGAHLDDREEALVLRVLGKKAEVLDDVVVELDHDPTDAGQDREAGVVLGDDRRDRGARNRLDAAF